MPKNDIVYMFHPEMGHYYYGSTHPMKPNRLSLTHELVLAYGLHKKMRLYDPPKASFAEMARFHSESYIRYLSRITPQNASPSTRDNYCVGNDCPVFYGMYDYCSKYTGASLSAAHLINSQCCRTAINWSGGLHHAKKSHSSGFCYVNDIVVAILELLRFHARVLYIDIDVHHGDGVQEAFYLTDRVMTLSFHAFFSGFFPETGSMFEIGGGEGKYFSLNVPFRNGIDDLGYQQVYKPIVSQTIEKYQPSCIVLQCGADSLRGDKLGTFNLSIQGHGECVRFVQSFNLPLLVLGGGGYVVRNVSRCWAYETSVLLNEPVSNHLPVTCYYDYFAPDYTLTSTLTSKHSNQNSPQYLDTIKTYVFDQLHCLEGSPSVQMQDVPPSFLQVQESNIEDNPDKRPSSSQPMKGQLQDCYVDETLLHQSS